MATDVTLPTAAEIALRSAASAPAREVAELPHVVAEIVEFALSERWTIPSACEANLLRLLPCLAARHARARRRVLAATAAARSRSGVTADRAFEISVTDFRLAADRIHGTDGFDRSDPFFHAYECRLGLVWAVKHDNLAMLEWLHAHCPTATPYAAMATAAELGNLRLLQWLTTRHPRAVWLPQVMDAAASTGQLAVLEWLQSDPRSRFGPSGWAFTLAAAGGHLESVRWLIERHPTFHVVPFQVVEAAKKGYAELTRYLFEQPRLGLSAKDGVKHAAAHGDLELVQWFVARSAESLDDSAIVDAASGGHLEVIQWLHAHLPHGYTGWAMPNAARGGHLDVLQWLFANRADSGAGYAMNSAASAGQLHVVQWLHANGTEGCTTAAMDGAAEGGHLETVKWLHENRSEGCTPLAMDGAAANGHLAVLKWLHAVRGERCSDGAISSAAENGHLDVIKWLVDEHGISDMMNLIMDSIDPLASAVEHGHLDVAKWVYERGFDSSEEACVTFAAERGHLDIVKWLHETFPDALMSYHEIRVDAGRSDLAMTRAAVHGHFDVVLYLYARCGGSGIARSVFNSRMMCVQHIELVQWLFENAPEVLNLDTLRSEANYMPAFLEHILGLPPADGT
ncbi:hypothetical protein PybrP1_001292 [[Pythium] brassicae (nom. inval.)]|nr:hypothetical protein PybrP1_001292 [[Pythium] brassicae (nom. inval.)]